MKKDEEREQLQHKHVWLRKKGLLQQEQIALPGRYEIGAAALIALSALLRLLLIGQGWPVTDSDESTMGLMALHIANRGDHPVFFYGQNYMGSFEAFLGAGLFHLFGPSTFTLRLGLIVLFVLFLICMYLLTSLLYSKPLALASLLLLSLGSEGIVKQELYAIGGYPETLLFGALVLLIASRLALSSSSNTSPHHQRSRYLVYACWGLAAGVGLWSDLLIIPIVLMATLLLLVGCWREWRTWALPCLLLGLVIGALPLLYYNLTALPGQDSLSVLLRIHAVDQVYHLPVMNQIKGAFFISLPIITGVTPSCPVITGQQIGFAGPHPLRCLLEYAGWGMGFTFLWIIASVLAIAALWKLRPRMEAKAWSPEERQAGMRQVARLVLLGSAGLMMLLYASSPNAAKWPQTNDRYLIGLLLAIPAVISPLWVGTLTVARGARIIVAAKAMLLLLIGLVFLLGTIGIFQALPLAQSQDRRQEALIHDLLQRGVTRMYSDYWTCDRVIFQSNEQIICSVIQGQLQPGVNRYKFYIAVVKADPDAAYVLPTDSSLAAAFERLMPQKGVKYQHLTLDGYEIYYKRNSSYVTARSNGEPSFGTGIGT